MSLIVRVYSLTRDKQTDLDLYGEDKINLNLSFSEIQDITKRNSAYTQSFSLPGSKKNNQFFNNFYDVNSSSIDYDINKKYPCDLLYNGYMILEGYLRLNEVNIKNTEKVYNVTFYNQVGDLAANVADKLICNLDMSDLDHTWSLSNILQSWDIEHYGVPTPPPLGNNGLKDGKLIYPFLHLGYEYKEGLGGIIEIDTDQTPIFDGAGGEGTYSNQNSALPYTYFKLAVQAKDIYKRIVEEAGYKIESDFFLSPTMSSYYYPLTDVKGGFGLNQLVPQNYDFDVQQTIDIFPSTTTYEVIPMDNIIEDVYPLWYNNGERFRVPFSGIYTFRIRFRVDSLVTQYDVDADYEIRLVRYNSSGVFQSVVWSRFDSLRTLQYTTFDQNVNVNLSGSGFDATDDYYQFEIFGEPNKIALRYTRVNLLSLPSIIPDQQVDVANEIGCEVKQIDFIQSINKWFNLVVVPKPNEPDTLIIEPYVNWVGSGDELDWTQKVDRSKNIKIEPTNKIAPTSVLYDVQTSKDFYNTEYIKTNTFKFGAQQVNYAGDFKSKEEKVSGIFGVAQDFYVNNYGWSHPIFYQQKEDEQEDGIVFTRLQPYKTIPKLIYYNGLQKNFFNGPYIWLKDQSGNTTNIINLPMFSTITTWPNVVTSTIGGTTTSITQDITFNKYKANNKYPSGQPNIDLASDSYESYYKQYLEQLHNKESRLVTCEVYLTPEEIKQLDFSERIRVDNTLYIINKISSYNLLKPSLAKVELTKLTDDFIPVPNAFYYKFTNCVDSEDIFYMSTNGGDWLYKPSPVILKDVVMFDNVCYTRERVPYFQGIELETRVPDFFPTGYIKSFDDCVECLPVTTTTTEAPAEYHYTTSNCGEGQDHNITIIGQPLTIGQVYDLELLPSGHDGCYTITGIHQGQGNLQDAVVVNEFDDCATCGQTPPPTTTTTTTEVLDCERWEIRPPTMSGELVEIDYNDCDGNPQSEIFGWSTGGQTYYRCVQEGTMVIVELGPGGSVIQNGLCI